MFSFTLISEKVMLLYVRGTAPAAAREQVLWTGNGVITNCASAR